MTKRASLLDRRALFSSAVAATLLAATGVSAAGPQRGGRLRMALSGASRDDSWATGDGLFMQVARQGLVFDTLTEVGADGTLRGELATGWTSSTDARVWSFDLCNGVRWHDNRRFDADDVVATLAPWVNGIVEAKGRLQVTITLHEPDARLPLLFAQPEHVIRPAHDLEGGIGTGLYRVTDFTPGQRLRATRQRHHYKDGKAGWFDEVELSSIPAEAVRGQALGEYLVDAVDTQRAQGLAALRDVVLLPDSKQPMQAVSDLVMMPAQVSYQRPLDNLRAAERWWFGTTS